MKPEKFEEGTQWEYMTQQGKRMDPLREGYEFVEWQVDGKKQPVPFKVTKDVTLVAVWKPTKETYSKMQKDSLFNDVLNITNELNKKIEGVDFALEKGNKLYVIFKNDLTSDQLMNNGVITEIQGLINKYSIEGYQKKSDTELIPLMKDKKALGTSELGNLVLEEFGKAIGIKGSFENIEDIINGLKTKEPSISAELTLNLGEDYENNKTTDNNSIIFVSTKMTEENSKKIDESFNKQMASTTTDVNRQGTFVTTYQDNNYILKVKKESLNKGGFRLAKTGFKTAMVNFLTGGNVNPTNGKVQEHLKIVVIRADGKQVFIPKAELDKIVKVSGSDMLTRLKPFLEVFVPEGKSAIGLKLKDLVGKSCTFEYTYVNDSSKEVYTVTRTMKFEQFQP